MAKDHLKDEILARTDIIEIISEYVVLHKKGKNFLGLCPFHNERTPSFTVSPDKQFYKCFGCGRSGNAITFLMEKNSFTFIEALKLLAAKAGIKFTYSEKRQEDLSEIEEIYNALDIAAKYFENSLQKPQGKLCSDYFDMRKFSKKIREEFRLGYSPNSFTALSEHLREQGFSDSTIEGAGLIVRNDEGKIYDRFRNRAIFPIFDIFNRIIGFGARILNDDKSQAKYLNSPQTKVYDKSSVLYGLSQGKNEIISKKFAILAEGYADILTLHQHGFRNSIASSGTSLTVDQLKLLSRYTKNLIIIFDADTAGINAAERAIEPSLRNGFDIKIVLLKQGEDPDSILRANGPSTFQSYLDNAVDFLTFLFDKYLSLIHI